MVKSLLKVKRLEKGYTQEQLARTCNVTTRTIQNLEKNPNMNIITLYAIKKALQLKTIAELFTEI